jgi:hypothetical protein
MHPPTLSSSPLLHFLPMHIGNHQLVRPSFYFSPSTPKSLRLTSESLVDVFFILQLFFYFSFNIYFSNCSYFAILTSFCVNSGFRRDVDEICALLGYCAAYSSNFLPTFRHNLSAPSSRVKKLILFLLIFINSKF